jgi:(S)-2-hydroxyglutarate dehydrogenase
VSDAYDVAIVGAGIVGLAVAREVMRRRPGSRLIVIDKEDAVGRHQTGHNSGVIHAGVYYAPGSLKARLCVQGAALMREFCARHEVPVERCGKLIVAVRESELARLAQLEARALANGVPGVRRVDAAEIAAIEPECRGIAALHSPSTAIVDFGSAARAIAAELAGQGVTFALGTEIRSMRRERDRTVLTHAAGSYAARWAVACAGAWSDRLAMSAGGSADPRIVPFRGAYLRVAGGQPPVVRGLIYPVPDPQLPFLGVHITRHIDGHVLLGPTALLVAARDGHRARPVPAARGARDAIDTLAWPGTWRLARRFWRTGLDELAMASWRRVFVQKCAQYVPRVESLAFERRATFGVRAQAVSRDGRLVDDFVLARTPGVVHVRNAPSPAATSSFALAREIADQLEAASAVG